MRAIMTIKSFGSEPSDSIKPKTPIQAEQTEKEIHGKIKKVSKDIVSQKESTLVEGSSLKGRISEPNISNLNLDTEFMNFRLVLNSNSKQEQWSKSKYFKNFINTQDLSQIPEEKVFELTALLFQGMNQHPTLLDEKFILSKLPEFGKQYYNLLKDLQNGSISLKGAYQQLEKQSLNRNSLSVQAAHIINLMKIPITELKNLEGWKSLDISSLAPHLRYFDVKGSDKELITQLFQYSENIHSLLIDHPDIKELPPLPNCQFIDCENLNVEFFPDLPKCKEFICKQCQSLVNLPKLTSCHKFILSSCSKIKTISDLPNCRYFKCLNCQELASISDFKNCRISDYLCKSCPKMTSSPKFKDDFELESIITKSPIKFEKGKAKISDFISLGKVLGTGGYGKVYSQEGNSDLAIKKGKKTKYGSESIHEYHIGHKIEHPNITKSHSLYIKNYPTEKDYSKSYLVMDQVKGTLIADYAKDNTKLPHEVIKNLIKEAQDCCIYLYKNNIRWNDLHHQNVFITDNHLKLIDFGQWRIETDLETKNLALYNGARQLVHSILQIASIPSILPESEEAVRISGGSGINPAKAEFGDLPTMKMNEQEAITFLNEYFETVLEEFDKYSDFLLKPVVVTPETAKKNYMQILEEQFFPKKGAPALDHSIIEKALSDFKKVCSDERVTLDLQLTYVEYGVRYCELNKYMDKQFINNMRNIFKNTLHDMKKIGVLQDFQERSVKIFLRATNIGWELHQAIDCYEYFDLDSDF